MSEPAPLTAPDSPLAGASFAGRVTITDTGPRGMITLRGDLDAPAMAAALQGVTGLPLPAQRRVTQAGAQAALWMSPDELLIILPHDAATACAQALTAALAGTHHLAINLSDARALIRLTGPDAALRDVMAKLAPVDMDLFAIGEIRRTRAGQIACAFWMPEPGVLDLICFRSVARYMFDQLCVAAAETGTVGHFD